MTSLEYETELKVYFDGVHYTVAASVEEHRELRPTSPDDHYIDRDRVRVVSPERWLSSWCKPGTTEPCEPESGCEIKMRACHWIARGRGYLFTNGKHL